MARRARKSATNSASIAAKRYQAYRQLEHPFAPQALWSEDRVEAVHASALRVLKELGIRTLLPEAREIFRKAGARVDEDSMFVWLDKDMVQAAIDAAPKSYRMRAPNPAREQQIKLGTMMFQCGAGCPNSMDRVRGRVSGSRESWVDSVKLQQHFDALHLIGPSVEPQDEPIAVRHYAQSWDQLTLTDKPFFVWSRGTGQVQDCFEMIQMAHGLDSDAWEDGFWATTIVNTNSPRQLDRPMGQGIIDFARAKQLTIVTPFCLNGAMAPVSVAGAITLQHAEALFGLTLAQLTRPGAPIMYGNFSSNVHMKSGAPAFGTPEHMAGTLASGQLARKIGIPWRGAAGSASNMGDGQGVGENALGLLAAVNANTTLTVHSAGCLEGGLSFGFEKFIQDMELVQTIADLAAHPAPAQDDDIAFHAIADVQPGGHFFATQHTMERYDSAHYPPLVADLSNYENWSEAGARSSDEKATAKWQEILRDFTPPPGTAERGERIAAFIERRKAEGGSHPMD